MIEDKVWNHNPEANNGTFYMVINRSNNNSSSNNI